MQPLPTHRASFSIGNEAAARRVVDVLTEGFFDGDAAVAAFERPDGQWDVTLHFAEAPDQELLRELVATTAEMTSPQRLASIRSRPRTGSRRALRTSSRCRP